MADANANAEAGAKFLAENAKKPGVVTTDSGLQYLVIEPGKGEKPTTDDTVRVNYKGSLLDGTVFADSSEHGGPAEFPLANVEPGWQEGITLKQEGSKSRVWIPSELGSGETGSPGGPNPPMSSLEFEVEQLDIVDTAP